MSTWIVIRAHVQVDECLSVRWEGGGLEFGFDAVSNKSGVWDGEDNVWLLPLPSASAVARFHCVLVCNSQSISIKVKGALQRSLLAVAGPSAAADVSWTPLPRLICSASPQHHCIMLHLHRIASALPLQDWPLFTLAFSPCPFYVSFSFPPTPHHH